MTRTCDFCSTSRAILYCVADSAKLCLACDREVHVTNPLFKKHSRSLLCDACDNSPSSILCSSESLSLCHNCDWESHRLSLSSPHDRRPLLAFSGCPSVDDLSAWLGIEDFDTKGKGLLMGHHDDDNDDDDCWDLLVWDTPAIVTIDDLIDSSCCDRGFPAMGVPPLPKNRNAACGKYKEEILSQLREMAKSERDLNDGHEDIKSITQFQFSEPQEDLYPADMYTGFGNSTESLKIPPFKDGSFWCTDNVDFANESLSSKLLGNSFEDSCLVPNKDSDIIDDTSLMNYGLEEQLIHHVKTESPQILPKFTPRELTSEERDFAISRYKEKKRTRSKLPIHDERRLYINKYWEDRLVHSRKVSNDCWYDKHIRYESRRIRAENRTRIKGRFAKIDHPSTGLQ